jgi:hypothetical protein
LSSTQTIPPAAATMAHGRRGSPAWATPGSAAPTQAAAHVQMPQTRAGSGHQGHEGQGAQDGAALRPGLKGMSPTSSQQFELDDALASTADLEGPCSDAPDAVKPSRSCLWRCWQSCAHCCCTLLSLLVDASPHRHLAHMRARRPFDLGAFAGGRVLARVMRGRA